MPTENHALMQQRAEHCNEAIRIIGDHGRRFFYSENLDRYARVEVDLHGRIWWVDDCSGERIDTHQDSRASRWHGFNHGGTLQYLAEQLCEYVLTGEPVPIWLLGPERAWYAGNVWGYPPEDMAKVRKLAGALPTFSQEQSVE
ncbi:hypothetical protein E5198_00675 [Pseudomonas sp. A-1]|uniref:hypothetical protein n=1 Tax=Pseudomonas sp. A-1 TaxID=1821274 RepID=UPI0010A5E88A|nr:hypothetical protein [Pseudomonas sp. A-1]THG87066.1 hypothetical protein E5198_00675 [Pseudomonas sp. A-1]